MSIHQINPDKLYRNPSVHHLAIDGKTVYLSSMATLDRNWNLAGRGDPEAHAEQVIKNVRLALASVGDGLNHIIKWSFYVPQREDIPIWRTVRSRYLSGGKVPAGSLLLTRGMMDPDFLVYINPVAVLP